MLNAGNFFEIINYEIPLISYMATYAYTISTNGMSTGFENHNLLQ